MFPGPPCPTTSSSTPEASRLVQDDEWLAVPRDDVPITTLMRLAPGTDHPDRVIPGFLEMVVVLEIVA